MDLRLGSKGDLVREVQSRLAEARIQIDAAKYLLIADLLEMTATKLPPNILDNLDLSQSVSLTKSKEMSVSDLGRVYKDKGVPPHRFAFSKVQQLLAKPLAVSAAHLELTQA